MHNCVALKRHHCHHVAKPGAFPNGQFFAAQNISFKVSQQVVQQWVGCAPAGVFFVFFKCTYINTNRATE